MICETTVMGSGGCRPTFTKEQSDGLLKIGNISGLDSLVEFMADHFGCYSYKIEPESATLEDTESRQEVRYTKETVVFVVRYNISIKNGGWRTMFVDVGEKSKVKLVYRCVTKISRTQRITMQDGEFITITEDGVCEYHYRYVTTKRIERLERLNRDGWYQLMSRLPSDSVPYRLDKSSFITEWRKHRSSLTNDKE